MWQRHGLIPNKRHSQIPFVEKFSTHWRIYYNTRINNKGTPLCLDVEIENPSNVLEDNSSPLLHFGDLGSFDVNGIMVTDLIELNNTKAMYYIGWVQRRDVPFQNAVGIAFLNQKTNKWEKFSSGPIFNSSYKEPGTFCGVPRIIKNDIYKDRLLMFYTSTTKWKNIEGSQHAIYNLKYAFSDNGIDWEPAGTLIDLKRDEGGITSPTVIQIKDVYLMWYSVRKIGCNRKTPENGYIIKCVKSKNLIDWTPVDILNLYPDPTSEWDNGMVCFPYVLEHKEKIYLFYSGNLFGSAGMGYAVMDAHLLSNII